MGSDTVMLEATRALCCGTWWGEWQACKCWGLTMTSYMAGVISRCESYPWPYCSSFTLSYFLIMSLIVFLNQNCIYVFLYPLLYESYILGSDSFPFKKLTFWKNKNRNNKKEKINLSIVIIDRIKYRQQQNVTIIYQVILE